MFEDIFETRHTETPAHRGNDIIDRTFTGAELLAEAGHGAACGASSTNLAGSKLIRSGWPSSPHNAVRFAHKRDR